tara:strand:- start:6 stop:749 length:744 start_codon:yes stop_codon:yes gene_type:complete
MSFYYKKLFFWIFFVFLFFISGISAWNWEIHENFAEGTYYFLEEDLKNKLDLEEMRRGAIVPDKEFKDFVRHHYPYSYEQALIWLDKSKEAYENEDYKNSSYFFGIASHYITDSFSSPHNIKGEEGKFHQKYENSASFEAVSFNCLNKDFELEKELSGAVDTGKDWELWLETRDNKIIKKHLEKSFEVLFFTASEVYGSDCVLKTVVDYEDEKIFYSLENLSFKKISLISVISALVILLTCSLLKEI